MKTADFDYDLPEELIAQTPARQRDKCRLLVVERANGDFYDRHFGDILEYLESGDALVLNDTKVMPARIIGQKVETGGTVELLLLKDLGGDMWECLARPGKRLKVGTEVSFGEGRLIAVVAEKLDEGIIHVKLKYQGILLEILEELGRMPLPPYIHEDLADQSRYQTVYAENVGSAAAPTAGLHFTEELLQKVREKGVKIVKVTLHVGLGTFRPVTVDEVSQHQMHSEAYEISEEAAEVLNSVREAGGRIIAVGTTSVRTLESNFGKFGEFRAESATTDIFITPGYEFKAVDGLITNFHLPKSTLVMLVSAFSSREMILRAYRHAVTEKYRFFSFGDAMLII